MPDNDTIRVQTADGQTGTIPRSSLPAAQKAGWKVIAPEKQAGPFTEGFASSMGFSGGNISGSEMAKQTWENIKKGVKGEYQRLQKMTGEEGKPLSGRGFSEALLVPGTIASGVEGLASGIEKGGKDILTPGKRTYGAGELTGSLGQLFAGAEAPEKLSTATEAAKSTAKPALRYISGAGESAVKKVAKETAEKQAGVVEKATAKREAAKGKYSDALSEQREKAQEASAKESAAQTKQQALATKQGPVYQRMNEMADQAQAHIKDVEAKVGKQESSKWDAFNEKMDNPTVKTGSVVDAIEQASAGLAGENVPIFKQVLNEIAEEDPMSQASVFKSKGAVDIKELMAKAAPAVRDRLIRDLEAQGFTEESGFASRAVDLPLDNARQLYTRISRVLNALELPRVVARAIGTVQEALDNNIAESITKKGGPEALRDYRNLQKDYRQYRETFSDRDSPLRKVGEAKDPHTKLGPITGETGERAVQYLGRYRNIGAQPEMLGKIRAMNKALKELPGGGAKTPAPVERPSLPKVPEMKMPSAEEIRKGLLTKRGASISAMPSGMMFFSPKWMGMRMLLKKALENPKFVDWLAKEEKSSGTPVP